jgi:uncharacterized protein with ParB-like and HNH nuclease domain
MNFIIPIFQRSYSWQESDCARLFEDVIGKIKDKTAPHFIGTVCYKNTEDGVLIVDGQQRITSLMLLLTAIRDVSSNKKIQENIYNNYLMNRQLESKFTLKAKDMNVYKKILFQEDNIFALNDLTEEDQISNVYKNYNKFCEMLYAYLSKNKKLRLNDFLKALEKIEFAVIELLTANPQVVFESLNSTGVNLNETDKIRNYILMPLSGQTQDYIYRKYWLYLENAIGSDMEDFLISYLIIKNRSDDINGIKISSKTLYLAFKELSQNHDPVMLLKELCVFERYYQQLYSKNNYLNIIFNLLKVKSAMTICLYLLEKSNYFNDDLSKVFNLYLSYILRSKVCERSNIKNSHSGYIIKETNSAKTKEDFVFLFKKTLLHSEGAYKFPSNREFKEALINNDIYLSLGSIGTKYLLYEIEKTEAFRNYELPTFESGTVEHIMPQTLNQEWEKYLEKDKFCYVQNLHTLGNLALTNYNSELSNKPFAEKCKIYKTDPYIFTQRITYSHKWGAENIKERAKTLSGIAVDIWKDISIEETVETNEICNIYNIPQNLTGKKPKMVYLMGEEKNIKSWNDLSYFITATLYDVDTITMLKFISQNDNHFICNTKPNGACRKLQDDIYIKMGGNATQKLMSLKKLMSFYDENSDVSISDKFWFTFQ